MQPMIYKACIAMHWLIINLSVSFKSSIWIFNCFRPPEKILMLSFSKLVLASSFSTSCMCRFLTSLQTYFMDQKIKSCLKKLNHSYFHASYFSIYFSLFYSCNYMVCPWKIWRENYFGTHLVFLLYPFMVTWNNF